MGRRVPLRIAPHGLAHLTVVWLAPGQKLLWSWTSVLRGDAGTCPEIHGQRSIESIGETAGGDGSGAAMPARAHAVAYLRQISLWIRKVTGSREMFGGVTSR